MFQRKILPSLINRCFKKKAIIIYGARQVGKTTLCKEVGKHFSEKEFFYCTGDDNNIHNILQADLPLLSKLMQWFDGIIIDEAQRVTQIGLIIKLLVDHFPEKQVIATWSSSFDLANKITEPLTGRAWIYHLHPLSLEETLKPAILTESIIVERLLYGSYPECITTTEQTPVEYLRGLVNNYLYKDILMYEGIQKPHLVNKILKALALQIWSEVSYTELANTVDANKVTIEKYITILEQANIITILHPLHNNQRREIKMNKKIYFRDLWVRNAVINNFLPLDARNDVGALRENFCIIERMKFTDYNNLGVEHKFRRRTDAGEIDLVEHKDDHYTCFECKRNNKKWSSLPPRFAEHYHNNSYHILTPQTAWEFLL